MIRQSRNPSSPPRKRTPLQRTGKVYQTVRVSGVEMSKLRSAVYLRAGGFCEMKLEGCNGFTPWKVGHLAHVRTKRNNGDSEQNTKWSCPACHIRSHVYGKDGVKPCPKK